MCPYCGGETSTGSCINLPCQLKAKKEQINKQLITTNSTSSDFTLLKSKPVTNLTQDPLALRIATEICTFMEKREIANPMHLKNQWDNKGSTALALDHQKRFVMPEKLNPSQCRFWETMGWLVVMKHKDKRIRCDHFSAAMTFFLCTNRNFTQPFEILFMGTQFGGGHYFVVVGRQGGSDLLKPETWGPDAFYMDPWGAMQTHARYGGFGIARPSVETDLKKRLIVNPSVFGNKMKVVCSWPARDRERFSVKPKTL